MKNKFTLSVIIALFVVFLTSGASAYNEITQAIKDRDPEQVKVLLDKGVLVGEDKERLFLEAAKYGPTETVKLLLGDRVDIESINHRGDTALMYAIYHNAQETVKLLLKSGANIESINNDGTWPLMVATRSGNAEIVKLLLKSGADVNAKDLTQFRKSQTPLMVAAGSGNAEIVELLLDSRADVNAKDMTQFRKGQTALMAAAGSGNAEIVELLLDSRADVNAKDISKKTALARAVGYNHNAEIVKLLLESGANANDIGSLNDDSTPVLIKAIKADNFNQVALLLYHGANVNSRISISISIGSMISILWGDSDQTALMVAASQENVRILKLLLEHSPDVNAKNFWGRTALDFANGPLIIELLSEAGSVGKN